MNPTRWLIVCGVAQSVIIGSVAWLSRQFAYGSPETERPIFLVVGLLMAATAVGLLGLRVCVGGSNGDQTNTRSVIGIVLGFAIAMRLMMLVSHPIQEVDLYRYLWDGAVANEGINPYRFSPASITEVFDDDPQRKILADRLASDPGLAEVHQRVHFQTVTTVYPPTSQVVFAATAALIPAQSSAWTHLMAMKIAITIFDLGVLLVIAKILLGAAMHPAWMIVYGWSPLVLKEFAGSGHLDSIAVFWMVAGLYLTMSCQAIRPNKLRWFLAAGAVCMALAVSSKLFPIVIAPIVVIAVWSRFGLPNSILWTIVFSLVTTVTLLPMFVSEQDKSSELTGLDTFLRYWEINDLIFMTIEENLRPDNVFQRQPDLWFVVTPNSMRVSLIELVSQRFSIAPERVPFMVTRVITTIWLGIMVAFSMWCVWKDPASIYAQCFMALMWLWFLSPTQNPWYWTWAMPLVVMAKNRAWLAVGGFALIYYLRFWCEYHEPTFRWAGSLYQGVYLFDFLIVWVEFVPLAVLLVVYRFGQGRDPSRRQG